MSQRPDPFADFFTRAKQLLAVYSSSRYTLILAANLTRILVPDRLGLFILIRRFIAHINTTLRHCHLATKDHSNHQFCAIYLARNTH
jgi:hypothetical protein